MFYKADLKPGTLNIELINRGDHFQFNGDGCGKAIDLDRRAAGRIFGEILGPQFIVSLEIVFHVREKNGHIHNFIPVAAGVLENVFHVIENAAALLFDIVGNNLSVCIELHAGNFFRAFFTRTHAGKEKQIAHALRMRVQAHGLGRFGRMNGIGHPDFRFLDSNFGFFRI